jgi:hypothetical protein
MSSLGNKIYRKAQVLGQKINSNSRILGEKANEALRMADVGLRKTQNTLQNRIMPLTTMLAPQLIPGGYAALNAIKDIRGKVQQSRSYAQDMEKGNLRKRLESDVLSGKIQSPFI